MIATIEAPCDLLSALAVDVHFIDEYRARQEDARKLIGSLVSSYANNGYDELFYALMRAWKPATYLEFGVLSGYSLLSCALAMKANGRGRAVGVDLFEDYSYKKDYKPAVQARIDTLKLQDFCTLVHASADDISTSSIRPEVLHVDISNTGDVVELFFNRWGGIVSRALLFEGGSKERDRVHWMEKYRKRPMHPLFDELSLRAGWTVYQVAAFPSLTAMVRDSMKPS